VYLEYNIYTHIDSPESGEHYFKILTANYSSAEYNKEGLLKFSQSVESLEEDSSDADLNLQTWDKLHEDWQEVYDKQPEEIYEKYLKKREFLFHIIQQLIIWFKDSDIKYPEYERKEFICSSDYRTILYHGKKYYPTAQHAEIIERLHESAINGTPDLSGDFLIRSTEYYENISKIPRLRDLFKADAHSKEIFRDLIAKGSRRDTFKLNL